MTLPNTIRDRIEAVNALVEKHPKNLPLAAVAEILHMNTEGLRAALSRGNVPFGFAYQKDDGGYRVMVIPTLTFYLWYTNTNAQTVMSHQMN